VSTAAETQGLRNLTQVFQDEMAEYLDDQIASMYASPFLYGGFDQAKYDEKRQQLRQRRAELDEGRKVCQASGVHVWGAIERSGGFCDHCNADGLARHEEYGSAWDDCSNCEGLGYTPTEYSRSCERCGLNETRST
jgi:hypothetical protein